MDRPNTLTVKQTGCEFHGPARSAHMNVCVCWCNAVLYRPQDSAKEKRRGPILERGGGGSDGGCEQVQFG